MRFHANGVGRWLSPSVFGIWTLAILYLLVTQRYTDFLRPGFGLLLALAHFAAMAFMLAAMTDQRPGKLNLSDLLRAPILLLPLLYLVIVPRNGLGGSTFRNRYIGPTAISADRFSDPSPKNPLTMRLPGQSPENCASAGPVGVQKRSILELSFEPMRYLGRRVTFTGMLMRDKQLQQYLGDSDTVVYRFLMTCCAADALPLAIALESGKAPALANDQWVQVEGDFQLHRLQGKPVPMVENAVIRPIDAPEAPYLFLTGSLYRR